MEIPTLEREYVSRGFSAVAGVDEVGRGPLAGPVVCAAVVMPLSDALLVAGVNDSKKLSAKKRELLAERIRAAALAYAIEEVGADVIDEINILQATRLCMKRAVEKLSPPADMALTDGNMTLDIACRSVPSSRATRSSTPSARRAFWQRYTGTRSCATMPRCIPNTGLSATPGTARRSISARSVRWEYARFIAGPS